ncbi:hypothetical protein [Rhodococcus zopfii]|uniref:hypothetical protein n=1 Tax=Rhodococcus zopfii TaxID=43772 RepID=UPI003529C0FF
MTEHRHPCGHVSHWGRCELADPIDNLTVLWGVAEVVPARPGLPAHLHPFQYCDTETAAVEHLTHYLAGPGNSPRPAIVLIRRETPGARWEATL